MIFCRDFVSCNHFDDYHDDIIVTGIDFIGRWLICGLYLQGERSSISSSMVAERKSRSCGDDSAYYVVPDEAIVNVLSTI